MAAHICSPRVSRCPGCCRPRTLALLRRPVRGPVLFTPRILCRCGLVGGRTAFGEGRWLGLFFLFVSAPLGKRAALCHTRFHTPTPLPLYPDPPPPPPPPRSLRLFPLSSACFLQGLTMNQMKKLLGRKASLPRYLAAYPAPGGHPGGGASGALSQVGRGFPAEGRP